MRFIKITIIKSKVPEKKNINEELQWFGASIGLFNLRDKDKSCFRIFIALVKALKEDEKLTSDEIAKRTNLTRGTIIHHLNKLMESGIVISQKNKYFISVANFRELVDVMENNAKRAYSNLREIAKDIDERLEL